MEKLTRDQYIALCKMYPNKFPIVENDEDLPTRDSLGDLYVGNLYSEDTPIPINLPEEFDYNIENTKTAGGHPTSTLDISNQYIKVSDIDNTFRQYSVKYSSTKNNKKLTETYSIGGLGNRSVVYELISNSWLNVKLYCNDEAPTSVVYLDDLDSTNSNLAVYSYSNPGLKGMIKSIYNHIKTNDIMNEYYAEMINIFENEFIKKNDFDKILKVTDVLDGNINIKKSGDLTINTESITSNERQSNLVSSDIRSTNIAGADINKLVFKLNSHNNLYIRDSYGNLRKIIPSKSTMSKIVNSVNQRSYQIPENTKFNKVFINIEYTNTIRMNIQNPDKSILEYDNNIFTKTNVFEIKPGVNTYGNFVISYNAQNRLIQVTHSILNEDNLDICNVIVENRDENIENLNNTFMYSIKEVWII